MLSYIYSIPYVLFFCYLCIIMMFEFLYIKHNKHTNVIRLLVIVGFILFIGLRGYVMADAIEYKTRFDRLPILFSFDFVKFILEFPRNGGFYLLMIISKTIFNDYLFFQVLLAILHIVLIDIIIRKYSIKYYVLPFLIFFIFSGLFLATSLIRNLTSILLFVLSLKYIKSKELLKYVCINLIGCTVHISSLMYLPLYFFIDKKIPALFFWIVFLIGNLLFVFKIEYILPIIDILASTLPQQIENLVREYSSPNRDLITSNFNLSFGFFERVFTFIMLMLCYKSFYTKETILFNIMLFYILGFYYFGEFSDLMTRIMYLFVCFYWILLPNIFAFVKLQNKYIFLTILLIIGIAKISQQTKMVIAKYDNIIFGIESPEQRQKKITQYYNFLQMQKKH